MMKCLSVCFVFICWILTYASTCVIQLSVKMENFPIILLQFIATSTLQVKQKLHSFISLVRINMLGIGMETENAVSPYLQGSDSWLRILMSKYELYNMTSELRK